jgi:hypothetical protein
MIVDPPKISTNSPIARKMDPVDTVRDKKLVKERNRTMATASFKTDSPKTLAYKLKSTRNWLKIART